MFCECLVQQFSNKTHRNGCTDVYVKGADNTILGDLNTCVDFLQGTSGKHGKQCLTYSQDVRWNAFLFLAKNQDTLLWKLETLERLTVHRLQDGQG